MNIFILYFLFCSSSKNDGMKSNDIFVISLHERSISKLINEIYALEVSLSNKPEDIKQLIARQMYDKMKEKAILENQVARMKDLLKR